MSLVETDLGRAERTHPESDQRDRPRPELVVRAEQDRQRPGFHFVAPAGWLNDPNGVGEWGGVFHLFYQYNPEAAVHDRIRWGHATSTDLLRWHDEPIALTPSAGADAEGCWSGVLVDDNGTPTLVYSGHAPALGRTQNCCLATGTPDLTVWTKDAANPVIPGPPDGVDVTELRDHAVWREGEQWHQIMGSGLVGRGGALLHFSGPTLSNWTYQGALLVADELPTGGTFTGSTWECPDLFAPEGHHTDRRVLVFSAWDNGLTLYPLYLTGRLSEDKFVPDGPARHLDLGLRHFYAPQSFTAADGRRIQFGWSQEARPDAAAAEAGWSGVMSLPRTLTLAHDGTLLAAPVDEIEPLRIGTSEQLRVMSGRMQMETSGDQLDLVADVMIPPDGALELAVRATEDLREATFVKLERDARGTTRLTLDRSRSRLASLTEGYDLTELGGTLPTLVNDRVALRVLVDHSIVEVFANGVPLTARVYPAETDAVGVRVSVHRSATANLTAWQMRDVRRGDNGDHN